MNNAPLVFITRGPRGPSYRQPQQLAPRRRAVVSRAAPFFFFTARALTK